MCSQTLDTLQTLYILSPLKNYKIGININSFKIFLLLKMLLS